MIRKVRFSNFYSFRGEQEISFLAKKKEGYDYFQSESGDQVTKIASFIGGNASGKTNVMRLFSFLSYFVCVSSKEESAMKSDVAYKTFFNNDETSNFYVEFEKEEQIFYYDFSVQNNAIKEENLYAKELAKGARQLKVFSRQNNEITYLSEKFFGTFPRKFLKNIRSDISLTAFLKAHYDIRVVNKIYDYFAGFRTNINERGEINNAVHQFRAVEIYLEDPDVKKQMEEFVCDFDLGLNSFEIKREIKENKVQINMKGVHRVKRGEDKLDSNYESGGTKALFFILAGILSALKYSSVIIIDELELGFHPEALNKLISYFVDKNENSQAQMIFSSHSLGFMNKLDMHQIYLVEKGEEGESSAYRLNEVENIRSDENFLAKYMAGAYGAFPKIRV